MSRVLIVSKDIAVVEAAIAKHPDAEIHWAVQNMPAYRNKAMALGLGRYCCVGRDVDQTGYDHVMKGMPRTTPTPAASWKRPVESATDEEE